MNKIVVLILALLVAAPAFAQDGPARTEAIAGGPKHKHPKLSTHLADLRRAVSQRTQPPTPGERTQAATRFDVESLPKSVRDAVRAGQMHITKDAEVQVYIEVTEINPANLAALEAHGVKAEIIGKPHPDKAKGEVLTAVPTVQALLPLTMIDQVAALPFVRYIRLPDYGVKSTGFVDSQGDSILKANLVRQQLGLDGTGVRVGVISDGIAGIFATGCTSCGSTSAVPSPISSGDLPNATGTRNSSGVLTSVSGGVIAQSFPASNPNLEPPGSDTASGLAAEGTAMLEIVHDLAPGAQLYFANPADGTSLSFQQAVNFLAANTDVVVDDIGFLASPPYDGTDPISTNTAADLNADTNPIRGYFTAVGNLAFDHWGEPWTDSTQNLTLSCPASQGGLSGPGNVQRFQVTPNTKDATNFGPSIANFLQLPNGATLAVILAWNDPFSASTNDYDLFLYLVQNNSLVSPLRCSVNPSTGTQPPLEALAYTNNSGGAQQVGILIQNSSNAAVARNFDMFIINSATGNSQNMNFYTPSGSVPAQADAGGSPVSVVSVGATDAQTGALGTSPATIIEPYSSQGPTEATPQAASRMKPDVTATDDVSVTGAGGFGMNGSNATATGGCALGQTPCSFPGTSAAAPHAAGVAALLLQSSPCLLTSSTVNTPAIARAHLRNFITSTAVPLPGVSQAVPNNIEGFGLINALAAALKTQPTPNAGTNQVLNGIGPTGTTVTLTGSATDPSSCPVTLNWSGSCGAASGSNASLMCPLGVNIETLTVSNGGAKTSLPTSTVQITVSDFSLSMAQPTASVRAGQSASDTVSVGSKFGAFSNLVSLACSGLPALATCSLSPASVTPGAGSMTSTLSISTTAPSSIFPMSRPRGPMWLLPMSLFLLLVLTAAFMARESRLRLGPVFAAILLCVVALIAACSGGGGGTHNPGTPAGTYTVTVTGTSNQLQRSATVTLTVQ